MWEAEIEANRLVGGLVVNGVFPPQDVTHRRPREPFVGGVDRCQQGDVVGRVAGRETPPSGLAHPHGAALAILSNQTSDLRQAASAQLGQIAAHDTFVFFGQCEVALSPQSALDQIVDLGSAGRDERRFFVLNVSDKRRKDLPYFGAITDQLNQGGYEAMLHDLLELDLQRFNIRRVPETEALREQKIRSMDPMDEWWRDSLDSGYINVHQDYHPTDWGQPIETKAVYDSYVAACRKSGVRYPGSDISLGMQFGKWFESLNDGIELGKDHWPRKRRYVRKDASQTQSAKRAYYHFPPLDQCCKAFEDYAGGELKWSVVEQLDEDEPERPQKPL